MVPARFRFLKLKRNLIKIQSLFRMKLAQKTFKRRLEDLKPSLIIDFTKKLNESI